MSSELIHVGFDNYLTLDRVLAVASPASAPMKRMVQRAKEQHRAIDLMVEIGNLSIGIESCPPIGVEV